MAPRFDPLHTTVFVIVGICWSIFWIAIVLRWLTTLFNSHSREVATRKRNPISIVGYWFQGVSYWMIFVFWRSPFTPITPFGMLFDIVLALMTVSVAIGSIWLSVAAVRTLGKQWSLTARVLEGHRLVTEGPYRLVRNPIYTGMLGMLIATALTISQWWVLIPATIIFLIGTAIRVRVEERLLHEAFGAAYDAYARRVPALIPYLI